MIISRIEGDNIIFRSNHVSNFVSLSGTLPRDRQKLVNQLDQAISKLKKLGIYDQYPNYYTEDC
jgi:hypothetical protein